MTMRNRTTANGGGRVKRLLAIKLHSMLCDAESMMGMRIESHEISEHQLQVTVVENEHTRHYFIIQIREDNHA